MRFNVEILNAASGEWVLMAQFVEKEPATACFLHYSRKGIRVRLMDAVTGTFLGIG